jgi:hypothetical protein
MTIMVISLQIPNFITLIINNWLQENAQMLQEIIKLNNYCINEFQLDTLAQLQQNTLQNNVKIKIVIPHHKGTYL